MADIDRLHHVGHIVHDMQAGLDLFTQLGFLTTPLSFPALPGPEGGSPKPFGVGNCHASFAHNFIELACRVSDDKPVPAGAHLAPLEVPAEFLPRLSEMVARSVDMIDWCLSRFEGLHFLVFDAPDADAVAERLTSQDIEHSGVTTTQRKIDSDDGPKVAVIRFLEIQPHEGGPSRVPEGRLAVAEPPTLETLTAQDYMDHPNGAFDLIESVLCVANNDLADLEHRYEKYLARAPQPDGETTIFQLEGAQVRLVRDSDLETLLPGERARAVPGFVAYAVAVHDAVATRQLLEANGLPVSTTGAGDLFVPSDAAMGANVIFRQVD
jgi:hypothetical protein